MLVVIFLYTMILTSWSFSSFSRKVWIVPILQGCKEGKQLQLLMLLQYESQTRKSIILHNLGSSVTELSYEFRI